MSPCYFITLTAHNRAGVLAAVTTALAELGGDMQYSAQTVVQGMFSMTVAARFPAHRAQEVIKDHLENVGRPYEMDVLIRPIQFSSDSRIAKGKRYFLTVNGQDAPGVVRTICAMLAQELVEIEQLYAVPDSSATFSMVMMLNLPEAVDLLSLNSDLELFAALNGLTISLQHENDYSASEWPRTLHPGIFPEPGTLA